MIGRTGLGMAIVLAATLAGCGGGGGGGDGTFSFADPVDKFVGTWVACERIGSTSSSDALTFTRSDATTANFSEVVRGFASTDCTGTSTGTLLTSNGSFAIVGNKTISGQAVDEVDITFTGVGLMKEVLGVRSDGKLVLGETGGTLDAAGYPETLQALTYTRQ